MAKIARMTNSFDAQGLVLAFDLAPVGLCVSRNRVIQICNRAFAGIFGFTPEELSGQSLAPLYISDAEFRHNGERAHAIMERTGVYSDERIMRRRSGEWFWCHVSGQALDRRNPFVCAVWAFEDISARRPVSVRLTGREREIAQLLITGKTSKQIAKSLGVSPRTVEGHRARLMRKYGVTTAGELISRVAGFS
jgi:PAS domain S-box-containing protein